MATRFPLALIEASMLVPRPEKVMLVLVAMRPPVERVPETSALPWTERRFEGLVVPMPTFPVLEMTMRLVVAVGVELDTSKMGPVCVSPVSAWRANLA